ncbi:MULTISPECIES: (2Fe-2S)-binding protein [Amycolatopsis]|uniref:2Fe-2S iron-sulfur cluster binding domain-containing protein n=1 Tax=Amycolatopsis dendrobii TaxID=2760662 RepID=A0A7W3ZDZ7_9PSEU|nr:MULTISPECIES: 2Fe-2S iron-sulfur cluster-binding protein [Amycolatopsis]MBB1157468.1 2Fe-2S iron-sulfur cluster binding domain-containing protein [Amycolatopsis dendrobii]UKD59138.1 2Fe-2S iron-sulfur cluster-binding protein [Amycolatopsis sp. FU40]
MRAAKTEPIPETAGAVRTIALRVDGTEHRLTVDPRRTLLDLLREQIGDYSAKKGCDHGQCGACTVLLDGRRVLSCLILALSCDGADVTTAAGLAEDGELHSLHQSFVDHDGFQCGYCTPGQICSAAGLLAEFADGAPSHVTESVAGTPQWTDEEISERMSGNLCRCGAYAGIVAAVREVGEQR